MATHFNNRKKKNLLALILSATMVCSTAAGFAACADGSTTGDGGSGSNPSYTTTETDTAKILNGSFDFYNDNDGKNLIISSVNNWTKTNNTSNVETTPPSNTASGIVNTVDDAWDNMTKSKLDDSVVIETVSQAEANWANMSAYDKLDFYDTWKTLNSKNTPDKLPFYNADTDAFNIKLADVPTCENPRTWDYDETATEVENKGVLMLHNSYTSYKGSAQKYTASSTVTVPAGTSAKISLWVKTSDLHYANSKGEKVKVDGNRGAYIGITHTAGGQTLDQMQVKNIDTEAVNPKPADETVAWDNNGWVNYTFYLKGSSFSNSTFTMVLGLGQADGTTFEFVNGYAFFDDVECEIISNSAYETATSSVSDDFKVGIGDTAAEKLLYADEIAKETTLTLAQKTTFALDLYSNFVDYVDDPALANPNYLLDDKTTVALTEEAVGGVTYVAAPNPDGSVPSGKQVYNDNFNITTDNDTFGVFTYGELAASTSYPLSSIIQKDFAKHTALFGDSPILMMLSADGANYTAEIKDNTLFSLAKGQKLAISFFLKTSALQGSKVNLTLTDEFGKTTKLTSLDVSTTQPIDTDSEENIYDGWQQCFFFVTNDAETIGNKTFSLKITLGSETIYGTKATDYTSGYAALTGFQVLENMSATQFKCISTGTYAAHAILDDEAPSNNDVFDTPMYLPTNAIEKDIANPFNYKGVTPDSGYISNKNTSVEINTNPYAGLINSNYIDKYLEQVVLDTDGDETLDTDGDYWATKLGLTSQATMTAFFGGSTQPLLIYNDAEQAYGFIGATQTISASNSTPTVISMRVKASAGAKVNVYLTDMDDYTHESTLSIGRRTTYWYDNDGNVCVIDPSDHDFNSRTDVAFKRQPNGLYKATATGRAIEGVDGDAYYFNLEGYETDDDGNLLVKEGGVSYNYNDYWKNDGNDGIAFYHEDGKYYADSAKTVEVKNFADTKLAKRYDAKDARDLEVSFIGDGNWQEVSFLVITGSQAKNYRLEIWSGSRDGADKNAAGSYLLVGKNEFGSNVASKDAFTDRIDEKIEEICDNDGWTKEEFEANYQDYFKSTYSFYDSDTFLRYDETMDANKVGNYYDEYKQSTYEESVAYFKVGNMVFADYSVVEQTPDKDSEAVNDNTPSDEENAETTGADVWLLASSLAIAVALLIAVVALVVRKVLAKVRKNKVHTATSQTKSVKNRRYSPKKKEDK